MTSISPAVAHARLHEGGEIAFLDVREAGQFGEGHPLFAVPLPYSRLETHVTALVPRHSVPIVLIDADDGVAERAAARLGALGYSDVAVVEGGAAGWEAAGLRLYKGVNVPSKTLGELAEEVWHPRTVTPEQLAEWRRSGRSFGLYDARPPQEYAKMRVPGAVCLPNGELAHRLGAVADETIVVTCAGRTRGITGAIGLRLAGFEGPVYALENGTQGWALAGFDLERGNRPEPYPALSQEAKAAARERADRVMARYGIPLVSAKDVERFLAHGERTTYLFDVRSAEEARDDPVPAAVHAPSGQLVQATDQWVGVRRSRLVLCDDSGLRAALAAFWLKQLGYEVAVARSDDHLRSLAPRPRPPIDQPPRLGASEALAEIGRGALLVDLRGSMDRRRAHVAGSLWSIRPRLGRLPRDAQRVVLLGDDEVAPPAAIDCRELGLEVLGVIDGGLDALAAAGARIEASPDSPADREAIDHLFFVHDRHDGNLEASRRYLAWETGIVAQLDDRERAEFSLIRPA
jgi:rhodanese-related sulfurtransferase